MRARSLIIAAALAGIAMAGMDFFPCPCFSTGNPISMCPSKPSSVVCLSAHLCYSTARFETDDRVFRMVSDQDHFSVLTPADYWELMPSAGSFPLSLELISASEEFGPGVFAAGSSGYGSDKPTVVFSPNPGEKPFLPVLGTYAPIASLAIVPGTKGFRGAFFGPGGFPEMDLAGVHMIGPDGVYDRSIALRGYGYTSPFSLGFLSSSAWVTLTSDDKEPELYSLLFSDAGGQRWTSLAEFPAPPASERSESRGGAVACNENGCAVAVGGDSSLTVAFIGPAPKSGNAPTVVLHEEATSFPVVVRSVDVSSDGKSAIIAAKSNDNGKFGGSLALHVTFVPGDSGSVRINWGVDKFVSYNHSTVLATEYTGAAFSGNSKEAMLVGKSDNGSGVFTLAFA